MTAPIISSPPVSRSARLRKPGHARGLSLIELMVVLAVMAVLLTSAVPHFQAMLDNQKLTAMSNELFAAVNLTRSEALARGIRVDLVPKDGKVWANGWVVFVDTDNDQLVGNTEKFINAHPALPAGATVTSSFGDNDNYLAFNGSGHSRANTSSQTMRAGSFLIDYRGHQRKILISFLGRARVCNIDLTPKCD